MHRRSAALVVLMGFVVSGCAVSDRFTPNSRNDTAIHFEPVAQVAPYERQLTEQAIGLEDAIRDVMRNAHQDQAGCTGDLADPGMAQCSEKQLIGRFLGGMSASKGKPVIVENVIPGLALAFGQLEQIDQGVTDLLEQQSSELGVLNGELSAGLLSQQAYDTRVRAMRQTRQAIAEALELSAEQAGKARRMFEKAQAGGQEGLTWYVLSMTRIQEVTAATYTRLKG